MKPSDSCVVGLGPINELLEKIDSLGLEVNVFVKSIKEMSAFPLLKHLLSMPQRSLKNNKARSKLA